MSCEVYKCRCKIWDNSSIKGNGEWTGLDRSKLITMSLWIQNSRGAWCVPLSMHVKTSTEKNNWLAEICPELNGTISYLQSLARPNRQEEERKQQAMDQHTPSYPFCFWSDMLWAASATSTSCHELATLPCFVDMLDASAWMP